MKSVAAAGLWCLVLAGCATSGGALKSTDAATSSAAFDSYVAAVNSEDGIRAVAVARDADRWALGSWNGAQSERDAITGAMDRCRSSAAHDGIKSPCMLYSVNGVVVSR